jgi:sulfate transport system substrate-binding protein
MKRFFASSALAIALPLLPANGAELLNVSYDPTREFYIEYNAAFAKYWKAQTGERVRIKQSHGGSVKQAKSVADGKQEPDVVTLGLASDIDSLAQKNLLPSDWASKFADNSTPYTSTVIFLVRKGNPKGIKEWDDLVKPGVQVITPDPKRSGGARWNYLAAWAYAERKYGKDDPRVRDFIARLYRNVPVLDPGARGATITFMERGIGDVLVAWENEAYLALQEFDELKEFGVDKFEIVTPVFSILAEPPVAVVESIAAKHGNTELAKAYLQYLYSEEGQDIAGRNFYRPRDPKTAAKYCGQFSSLELVTIQDAFGGLKKAQATHFDDGAIFDQIYNSIRPTGSQARETGKPTP